MSIPHLSDLNPPSSLLRVVICTRTFPDAIVLVWICIGFVPSTSSSPFYCSKNRHSFLLKLCLSMSHSVSLHDRGHHRRCQERICSCHAYECPRNTGSNRELLNCNPIH